MSDIEKKILINLCERIKRTWPADTHRSTTAMLQKASDISGISEYVLYPILKDVLEPTTTKKPLFLKNPTEATTLNSSDKSAIRKLVHDFYLQGEMPTVYRIYYALRERDSLPNVSVKTLKGALRRLRFKYLMDNNTVLLQSNGAALRRINYIQNVVKFRNENRNFFFVDKTSIKAGKCLVSGLLYLLWLISFYGQDYSHFFLYFFFRNGQQRR